MAAPTNAANVKKALANSEPSTHGTKRTIAALQQFGRYWTNNGQREAPGLNGSAANDPYATSGKPLLDRLGGNSEHARWNGEAERFCGHGAVRPIASRKPRRLLSSKSLQSSSGECRLNSVVLRARRIA